MPRYSSVSLISAGVACARSPLILTPSPHATSLLLTLSHFCLLHQMVHNLDVFVLSSRQQFGILLRTHTRAPQCKIVCETLHPKLQLYADQSPLPRGSHKSLGFRTEPSVTVGPQIGSAGSADRTRRHVSVVIRTGGEARHPCTQPPPQKIRRSCVHASCDSWIL